MVAEQLASMALPEMTAVNEELLAKQAHLPEDEPAAAAALIGSAAASQQHNMQIDRLFDHGGALSSKVCHASTWRARNAFLAAARRHPVWKGDSKRELVRYLRSKLCVALTWGSARM